MDGDIGRLDRKQREMLSEILRVLEIERKRKGRIIKRALQTAAKSVIRLESVSGIVVFLVCGVFSACLVLFRFE